MLSLALTTFDGEISGRRLHIWENVNLRVRNTMHETNLTYELSEAQIREVNGGFVCGGVCVAAGFAAGAALGYIVVDWAMN